MFGQGGARRPGRVDYPQQSTTGHGRRQRKGGTSASCRCSNSGNSQRMSEEGAMRLPVDRQSSPLPKRFPVGARYVVEGRGGEDGHLRVVSRYVVLPGGQRINVPSDLEPALGAERACARGASAAASQAQTLPHGDGKKLCEVPEPPGNTGIDHRRRAKPPSPSPSITRRRTPAVLAAGVPLCAGHSLFIAYSGQRRRGQAEQKRASVVSGTLA